ncbi:putative spermidine/putrescine transport system substrate-binding protein [Aminobacter aminovorans]|jgi:putative spermidine/putrescine transport system substrate-binding protein|uniref:Spermidine/putrescine-binding periplasmic protein n=1 Tax=Aminobacter aminovorans TaxID=83263 RepID=A0A380WFH5_AMIAI|nr:ABC transporter substrate-binding protein [Aminobacter aminovorans]TCS25306.1 putative spermidine/putrescine transport system substrate-binding protein [Aminobacter aminovorans]SUU86956.1 Spermidine/putrescine-binding periplasmic protein precursor [Aminobacter aminovorans]
MIRKNVRNSLSACALLAAWGIAGQAAQAAEVTVAVGGGVIQEVGRETLWGPAAKTLGNSVREETINDAYASVKLQAAANAVTFDLVQTNAFQAEKGGREGLFMPLDYGVIDSKDFIEGTAQKYCISALIFSWVMAWNTDAYKDKAPQSWADFWDVEKFPGRRAMRNDAEAQLEIALLADGVPMDKVYEVLGSEGGMQRALDKIEQLRPHIAVWWNSGAQHAQLMKDKEVDMSVGWNARFEAAKKDGAKIDYTFNQGVMSMDCWAVPVGAPHAAEAMKMINEMSKPEAQAKFSVGVKYGAANKRAYETGLIPDDVSKKLPTYPDNAAHQLAQRNEWWVEHVGEAQLGFQEMMSR